MSRKPLSHYHPILYWLRVNQRRLFRSFSWYLSRRHYSVSCETELNLPYRHKKHTSKLIRRLGNSDIQLQYNKVVNLKLAIQALDGILIRPHEYFSFCKLVGKPTAKRGYIKGMELSFGEARQGIGGGICQISNLIHWISLHSELQVVERANHSFDPFPDNGRTLPFGSGAAIFYNFIDLVLYNPTQMTYQLRLTINDHQLVGELRADKPRHITYHLYEKAHRFIGVGEQTYRANEIWRDKLTKHNVGGSPQHLGSECLYKNHVKVKYKI